MITVTKENAIELALSTYLEDICGLCNKSFTREDLNSAVGFYYKKGRIAHKNCFLEWIRRGGKNELDRKAHDEP